MVREEVISDFFDSVLKGESKTYDDHNWYTSGGLKGYVQGQNSYKYPYLKKPLSEYTIGEITDARASNMVNIPWGETLVTTWLCTTSSIYLFI